jgi:hypothetical protein
MRALVLIGARLHDGEIAREVGREPSMCPDLWNRNPLEGIDKQHARD